MILVAPCQYRRLLFSNWLPTSNFLETPVCVQCWLLEGQKWDQGLLRKWEAERHGRTWWEAGASFRGQGEKRNTKCFHLWAKLSPIVKPYTMATCVYCGSWNIKHYNYWVWSLFCFCGWSNTKIKGENQVWEVRFCPPAPPLTTATICLVAERGSCVHLNVKNVKSNHRSKFSNLSKLERSLKKKSGIQQDSNLWPSQHRCNALPTELRSHTLGARSIYWVYIFPCSVFIYLAWMKDLFVPLVAPWCHDVDYLFCVLGTRKVCWVYIL